MAVHVLEAAPHVGGRMITIHRFGWRSPGFRLAGR